MASALVIVLVVLVVPFFILGVLGNIGVLLCVVFTPSLRTRANAIIVSLTTSCLAFLVTVVPFTLDSFIHTDWRFAVWYCHATAYLSFAFIGITVFNIAALSLYRYFCVVHPTRMLLRSKANLILLIAISWLVPLTTQTLISSFHIARTEYIPMYARCVFVKVGEHSTLYNILVLGGFLPTLGLTLYSYAGIYVTVRLSARRLRQQAEISSRPNLRVEATENEGLSAGAGSTNSTQHPVVRNTRRTSKAPRGPNRDKHCLTKICVVVFVLFMVCYGPIVTLTAIYAHDDFPAAAYMICTVVYWLGSCLHPLVYAILQPQIRRSFLRLAGCCCKSANFSTNESSVGATTTGQES
ncbi:allatostatin-A receptor-like [Patiria miniata]|uniref:G-protein coupled receptors family 1 profile domain-containing protein n=1 Tax=Patiria miniata TaxID=46514 RepID=A0A914A5B0_PATMI|nr:allatostatin-A receptor-like [Patiria miniata]